MNKIFILTILLGVLLFSVGGVIAVDQNVEVDIGEDVHIVIAPGTLDFGTVMPGNDLPATNGPITFDPAGSNVDVDVEVTGINGFPFEDGLMLDGSPAMGQSWVIPCTVVDDVCTFVVESTVPTLDVPPGSPQGFYPGTITYTVTGPPPPI